MHRFFVVFGLCGLLLTCLPLAGQDNGRNASNGQVGPSSGGRARGTSATAAETGSSTDSRIKVRVRLRRAGAPTSARVSIVAGDGKSYGPRGATLRKTKRDESYFY